MSELSEFALSLQGITSTDALWDHALAFFHARGIARVSYHVYGMDDGAPATVSVISDGFPTDWVCHYLQQKLYRIDPIPELALRMNRPFLWSEVGRLAALRGSEKEFLSQLDAAELGDGLALQVFGPGLRNGYVGLGFAPGQGALPPEQVVELQCAAQLAHQTYCALTQGRVARSYDLSPREREILEWIARGKSNSVIAQILDVSPHTIDTLVRRLFDKLGVTDRTTAALKGVGAGLLQPQGRSVA